MGLDEVEHFDHSNKVNPTRTIAVDITVDDGDIFELFTKLIGVQDGRWVGEDMTEKLGSGGYISR